MSETRQLEELRNKALKSVEQIQEHLEKLEEKPDISDVERYFRLNSDIESDEEIAEVIQSLSDLQVLQLKDDKVAEIDTTNLYASNEDQQNFMQITMDASIFQDSRTKKELAQNYSDHLINEADIVPVWINGATIFYRFNSANNTWDEIDFQIIRKKAKKDLGNEYSRGLKDELINQMTDHYRYIEFDKMGLPENEILMKNGKVLNMNTLETREIEKKDYALNCVNAVYDEGAESGQLEAFIEQTIDTENMVRTLQEFLGYSLNWPSDKYEKMLLILGNTDTGKSTLLKVVEQLYDESNITKLSFPQIGMDRAFHIKDLKDSVLNIDSDMDDQSIRRKSRLKKVVSKEEVFVEPKGKSGFTMKPKANFIVTSNDAPDDAGATDAYYNRFLTLTATSRISEEDKDRELIDKLTNQESLNWFFTWSVKGLRRLKQQNQFTHQLSEYQTKKVWDRFGNSVQKFISEEVIFDRDEGRNIPTTDLYEAYQTWCETELEQEVSQNKFIAQASSHPDIVKRKTETRTGSRRTCFVNLRLQNFVV